MISSELLRSLAYLLLAGICVAAYLRERQLPGDPSVWPTFWLLTGIVLAFFGLARGLGFAEALTATGRETAHEGGWYEVRRGFQALVVGAVGALWLVSTTLAAWRFPERRRRYLPAALIMIFIVCFAALRAVSLHHVDQLLYNHELAGMRPVVIIELGALAALAMACAGTFAQRARARMSPATPK